jgi:hypothetical protein
LELKPVELRTPIKEDAHGGDGQAVGEELAH